MASIDDELDAALAELASSDEENEASPASPGKGGATESIDFGAIAGQTGEPDWFEKEREAERQSAALQRIADPHGIHDPSRWSASEGDPYAVDEHASSPLAERLLNSRSGGLDERRASGFFSDGVGRKVLILVALAAAVSVAWLAFHSSAARDQNVVVRVPKAMKPAAASGPGVPRAEAKAGGPAPGRGCASLACPKHKNCTLDGSVHTKIMSNHKASAGTAIVINSYVPTDQTMATVLRLAAAIRSQVRRKQTERIDVWINLDETNSHNGTHMLIMQIKALKNRINLGKDVKIHEYRTGQVVRMFPVVAEKDGLLGKAKRDVSLKAQMKKDGCKRLSAGLALPLQALLAWNQHIVVQHKAYEYVWVLEDDVGVTGDLANITNAYASSKADLLTHGCGPCSATQPSSFVSPAFEAYVPEKDRLCSFEFVQRFSARLLKELATCSLRHVASLGGHSACSLATKAGMHIESLRPEHVGTFLPDRATTPINRQAMHKAAAPGESKFYHSVAR